MADYWIGIDWGGTRVKLGAISATGEVISVRIVESPVDRSIDLRINLLLDQTAELIGSLSSKPAGIGLGLTGPVDPNLGVVYLPGKIKGLQQYPIVPRFAERFEVPTTADNDGRVAMIAERHVGLARDVDWATVITLGTGVGSGVLVAGQVLVDPFFLFGTQLGHLVLNTSNDQLCLTGSRGTGEMICSATALALAVRSGLQRGIPSTLTEQYQADPGSIDFRTVIQQGVERDDLLCVDEFRRWRTNLGWLCVNAIHAYASQIIILSGGATLAAAHFLPQVQEHVNRHAFRYPPDRKIPVLISQVQEHAGVIGAALLCRDRYATREGHVDA